MAGLEDRVRESNVKETCFSSLPHSTYLPDSSVSMKWQHYLDPHGQIKTDYMKLQHWACTGQSSRKRTCVNKLPIFEILGEELPWSLPGKRQTLGDCALLVVPALSLWVREGKSCSRGQGQLQCRWKIRGICVWITQWWIFYHPNKYTIFSIVRK